MARRRRRNNTTEIRRVQGPQRPNAPPQEGLVQINADLTQQYLGTGLVGAGPYLQVLNNNGSDPLLIKHGYPIYRQMVNDSEVDASLDTLVESSGSQPIRAIASVPPGEEGHEESQRYADFVNYCFDQFDIDSWHKEQTRAALTFGNACSEIDWDFEEYGKYRGSLIITNLRRQEPENYGYITDRYGEIYGTAPLNEASGLIFPLGNLVPLSSLGLAKELPGAVPVHKLAIWTWKKQGNDPRGTSILGPAYIPWWSKQRAIEEWSCWIGRFAQPSLWGTPGPDAVPICDPTAPPGSPPIEPTKLLLNALLNYKSASVLALPHGSVVNMLQAQGGAKEFIDSIRAWNTEITRAILGQHLATAEGENQSRAAADVHSLVLRQLINSIRRWKAKLIRLQIVKPLIEINYGDVGKLMPDVDLGDGDGWQPTITEIAVLMQSGYFTEDQLQQIDKMIGVPVRKTDIPTGPAAVAAKVQEIYGTNSPNNSNSKNPEGQSNKPSPNS